MRPDLRPDELPPDGEWQELPWKRRRSFHSSRRGWGGPGWGAPHTRRRPQWLFLRFAAVFGLFALVLLGGLALLVSLIMRLAGGDRQTAVLLWLGTCGLLLLFPLFAGWLGRRAFHNIATPLSNLMDGAERVAAGDLSVRVPVGGRGEFAQLSSAFNRMVEELFLADSRRRNLTADVAHELRTPLQIIQGNLEGVIDGVYEPTPEHLEATLAETRLLARLVEDLRVLSQAESGQLLLHLECVDVGDLLADVMTSFSGQAQVADVTLVVHLPRPANAKQEGAPLVVMADYDRLAQVLDNLMVNALRHTPPGGAVTLGAAMEADSVRLTVEDSGEGIAPTDLPFVFDRFWRGDRARTHNHGAGSGLGLAIARQFVQAHGGTIIVRSTLGKGTTFVIDLPLEVKPTQI